MESSEDDAGTATNASRRETARERDLGRLEDVEATSSFQQYTSEPRTSCQTPAMSEDNFDGYSVSSPSNQDVNTSTEAILDMIDEIVDGPGAPKRLPLLLDTDATSVLSKNEQPSVKLNSEPAETPSVSTENPLEPTSDSSEPKNCINECLVSDKKCIQEIQNTEISLKSETDSINCESSEPPNFQIKNDTRTECLNNTNCSANSESKPVICATSSVDTCVENVDSVKNESKPCLREPIILNESPQVVERSLQEQLIAPCILENEPSKTECDNVNSKNNDTEVIQSSQSISQSDSVSDIPVCAPLPQESSKVEGFPSQTQDTILETVSSDCSTDLINPSREVTSENPKTLQHSEENHSASEPEIIALASSDNKNSLSEVCSESIGSALPQDTNSTETTPQNSSSTSRQDFTQYSPCDESSVQLKEPEAIPTEVHCTESIATISIDNQEASSTEKLPEGISPTTSTSGVNNIKQCSSVLNSESNDRTLKCVSSSERRDIVVESAESTSSDNRASESKTVNIEPVKRTPLRRRLVRPTPNRPDSTVSSTFDSSEPAHSIEQLSECIKDVSSSSDAVSTVQGSIKAEESRNLSEISICKAETSSPPKKIRLIRQKCYTSGNNSVSENERQILKENEQCESTSSSEDKQIVQNEDVDPCTESISQLSKCSMPPPSLGTIEKVPSVLVKNDCPELSSLPGSSSLKEPESSNEDTEKVPPIKLNLSTGNTSSSLPENLGNEGCSSNYEKFECEEVIAAETERTVPKLTIKVNHKPCSDKKEPKSPVPKITIKPIKPQSEETENIVKFEDSNLPVPSITKLNIKPLPKPPEKINEVHRKSSSSEISESECSENDESASTSDQASASDQGPLDVVPKVTIKLGKPGTVSEGQFYTEPNIPKLTIKGIQNSNEEGCVSPSKLKVVISEDKQIETVPKLTIKSVNMSESQPLSPKLTIKPLKPPETVNRDIVQESTENPPIPKLKISKEPQIEQKDITHVPKITIKPLTKPDSENIVKAPKKALSENLENIPVVTRLNIKPIVKPENNLDVCQKIEDKVPVVSKLNIKPIVKPNEVDISKDESIPKITKLNIKPIKSPEGNTHQEAEGDEVECNETLPIVTKINIKPILNPEDISKESEIENHSSETGNSSDDNNDNIPVVTKINIKPICKPSEIEDTTKSDTKEENIPIITKLNIKPLVKPDHPSPLSPKKERIHSPELRNQNIPVVTKLNIKPVVKPDDMNNEDFQVKNPPLLMKINRKTRTDSGSSDTLYHIDKSSDQYNNMHDTIQTQPKLNIKPVIKSDIESVSKKPESREESFSVKNDSDFQSSITESTIAESNQPNIESKENQLNPKQNCNEENVSSPTRKSGNDEKRNVIQNEHDLQKQIVEDVEGNLKTKIQSNRSNCTLLKQLLESRKHECDQVNDDSKVTNCLSPKQSDIIKSSSNTSGLGESNESLDTRLLKTSVDDNRESTSSPSLLKVRSIHDLCKEVNESVTKPLEINISDKTSQSSDQDSPRIILKINKTDHGASAKIITEEINTQMECKNVNTNESTIARRRPGLNIRKKPELETATIAEGKRLRSSKIVQSPEKTFAKRNIGKRPSNSDASASPPSPKEAELSVLDSKRLKLGQLLSSKTLTITPVVVSKASQLSPTETLDIKQSRLNHTLLNNENCAKNGSSKLHNILSNLHANQLKVMPLNDIHQGERKQSASPELKTGTSLDNNPNICVEISPVHQNCAEIRETIFQDPSESRDFNVTPDPLSQDPLEMTAMKPSPDPTDIEDIPKVPTILEMTPQPKKRGRPRKLPVSEGAKPIVLPTPALEERPQRSLRLSRDRPTILAKPRGRGRGRGRRLEPEPPAPEPEPMVETANKFFSEQKEEIDPTSSRIKLPRMTEVLDKMPSTCVTPLSSRRRNSSTSTSDLPFFNTDTPELKVVLETSLPRMENPFEKSPEMLGEIRGRGGRGGRGRGRGRAAARTPRGRGRGRGGGRGAMYMKETMGIYGRVCGPATTTVQLFEEETCMMDDNATPAKPSHLLDEDSQSSVKSSTNESSKTKKSKFADLFDSNKVWSASDVKEYTWPPPEDTTATEHQVMMIQEQVAMFLGVKSFKRRYPELKRRAISAQERDYVLSKGIVTEALCDLGITAVDASEVLDIMLSDFPHKYEEYRSYQRERQMAEPAPEPDVKQDVKPDKASDKPEPPKVDPEKTRQDMAAAAIASASEWNTRINALRRPACVDLQTLTVQRRRAPLPAPRLRVEPPHGFYPHALLPGQYQHTYRVYSAEQLRYFPLNTVMAAPPAPASPAPSSSESDGEWGSQSSSDSEGTHRHHKRKKLTKVKRSSETESCPVEEETCRVCKLRLEANRKATHERFLVCATCNAKLHPGCVELPPDTIRKCREYAWQCGECKRCAACARAEPRDMLFCELCDRGHHLPCVGLQRLPEGRWFCSECAICKSCGARSPSGPGPEGTAPQGPGDARGSVSTPGGPQWHHHTKRGPAGHKLYSHSLCTPCARAYRIGRYCPLCDRSFIGPKGTMQLVICKLCDRQLHQDCVKQTVSNLNVLDYTCGECRRGGITSRAAAVRVAPRTIATLFMAKRRFNKYAHRQYMQKCKDQGKDSRAYDSDNDDADAPDVPEDVE